MLLLVTMNDRLDLSENLEALILCSCQNLLTIFMVCTDFLVFVMTYSLSAVVMAAFIDISVSDES